MKAMGMESDQEVAQMVGRDPRYGDLLYPSIQVFHLKLHPPQNKFTFRLYPLSQNKFTYFPLPSPICKSLSFNFPSMPLPTHPPILLFLLIRGTLVFFTKS